MSKQRLKEKKMSYPSFARQFEYQIATPPSGVMSLINLKTQELR